MSTSTGQSVQRHCETCRCPYGVDGGSLTGNIQELDDYIDFLYAQLSETRGRRNGLTSPSRRLPTEILGEIFLHIRDIAEPENIRLWLPTVSHVCTFWRAAAISWTQLWTQPDLSRSELAATMISRAGRAPITLHLAVPTQRLISLRPIYHAISPTSRIKGIDFIKSLEKATKDKPLYKIRSKHLSGIISRAKNHLQHLKLVHPTSRGSPLERLSSQVADAIYPFLETLHLSGWDFKEWTMTLISCSSRLRSLTVDASWSHAESFTVNIDHLLAALQGLRRLECLTMHETLPDPPYGRTPNPKQRHRSINLPRLSRLQITDNPIAILCFIERLQLPLQCQISMKCCTESSPEVNFELLQRLFTPAPHTIRLYIENMNINVHTYMSPGRQEPHHSATIQSWYMASDISFGSVVSQLPPSTALSVRFSANGRPEKIQNLLKTASAETMRWEWAGRPYGPATTALRDLVSIDHALPHLTTMIFDGLDLDPKNTDDQTLAVLEDIIVKLARIPTLRTLRLIGCANIPAQVFGSWRLHVPELVIG